MTTLHGPAEKAAVENLLKPLLAALVLHFILTHNKFLSEKQIIK